MRPAGQQETADPETMQAALTNHYFWPILPWLMMAAAAGASNLSRRWPRAAGIWVLALLARTLVDNPALRRVFTTRLRPEGAIVRSQLRQLRGRTVLAQNNLIPQLPHQADVYSFSGADAHPAEPPDLVLLTPFGDMWPQTPDEVGALIRQYEADPAYREVSAGPLYAVKLKE